MSKKLTFVEVKINWSRLPLLVELEAFMAATSGYTAPPEKMPSLSVISKKGYKPAFTFRPEDYVLHETTDVTEIKNLYVENGFETKFLIQDPFGHPGPTVACPVGFPFNLPESFPELRRFNRWICRVHVDICKRPDDQKLISVPHIEPDPSFHKVDHLWHTFIRGKVVRGKTAVKILKFLGI